LAAIQETIYFVSGITAAILSAYGGMKASGRTLYPVRKIEAGKAKIQALTESNVVLGEVAEIVSEISADELSAMIEKQKDLDAASISHEQQAITLGTMFLNAMKKQ
jgi:hypothetical protein